MKPHFLLIAESGHFLFSLYWSWVLRQQFDCARCLYWPFYMFEHKVFYCGKCVAWGIICRAARCSSNLHFWPMSIFCILLPQTKDGSLLFWRPMRVFFTREHHYWFFTFAPGVTYINICTFIKYFDIIRYVAAHCVFAEYCHLKCIFLQWKAEAQIGCFTHRHLTALHILFY